MSATIRKIINTALAPQPVGPYSQAVLVNETLYVSGQIGLNPQTAELVSDNVQEQAKQTMDNMKAVLEAGGTDFSKVVKTTVLLQDINDWPKVNEVYAKYFVQPFPARAAYAVAALPKGAKVEIEAVAVIGTVVDE